MFPGTCSFICRRICLGCLPYNHFHSVWGTIVLYNVPQYVLNSCISLLHVLLFRAISVYCDTLMLFLLQLNIPVLGPASLLPNPPGYLQPPFHPPLLIPPYRAMDGTVLDREKKKKNARTVEYGRGGGEQPCIKLFFKWRWSERRSMPKGGGTNRSVRGPREAGSQLSWPSDSLLSLVRGAPSFINGRLSARHGWPFLPVAFEATMTAVITTYVKTCHADFTPKVFRDMTVGR